METYELTPSQKYYTAITIVGQNNDENANIWGNHIDNFLPSGSEAYEKHYNNQYKVKIEMMSNPTYLCEVIKDLYIRSVLAIKYNNQYLYKMFLHPKYNKGLWDYLFDENKVLFWCYRFLQNLQSPTLIKYISFKRYNRFSNFINEAKHYYYQIAPETRLGKWFKKFKKTKKVPREIDNCIVLKDSSCSVGVVFQQKKLYTKRMIDYRVKDKQRFQSHYEKLHKNFWFVKLEDDNYYTQSIGGEHFDYNMDLTKNCLVWDANAKQFRKERIFQLWESCFDHYKRRNNIKKTIKNVPHYESDGLVYYVGQYYEFAPEYSFLKKFDEVSWAETKLGFDRRKKKARKKPVMPFNQYFMERKMGGKYDWDKLSNPD